MDTDRDKGYEPNAAVISGLGRSPMNYGENVRLWYVAIILVVSCFPVDPFVTLRPELKRIICHFVVILRHTASGIKKCSGRASAKWCQVVDRGEVMASAFDG